MKRILRFLLLPWWALLLPKRKGFRPYFGPPTPSKGGPDLKLRKLKARLGNSWWPSAIYVLSGKPLPITFLRAAKHKGIRIVLNQNGVYYPAWFPNGFEAKNAELAALHEVADIVIFQSEYARSSSLQWVRPPERPYEVLPNGVDLHQFHPGDLSRSRRPFRLLAATYFNPSKAYLLDFLADFAGLLAREESDVVLRVAGAITESRDGGLPARVQDRLKQNGGASHFVYLGPYNQEEAPAIFRDADALLHLVSLDCCPSAVVEGLASGLPVIFGRSGGTPELVGSAGCDVAVPISFDSFQTPSLADVLAGVRNVRREHERLSRAARQRAEHQFSMDTWIEAHRRLLRVP